MSSSTNRPGFQVQSPLSDEQIWGIGMVTYQWGCLENEIDLWITVTTGKPFTRSAGQRASFKERAKLLRSTFDDLANDPWRKALLTAVDRAKQTQDERDAIVHQLWATRPSGTTVVNEWRKQGRWKEKAIGFQTLQSLSLKIDSIRGEFYRIAIEACKCAGVDPNGATLRGAWQYISGKQGRFE